MLGAPPATAVASGPFNATLFLRMDSTTPECMKSALGRPVSGRVAISSHWMLTPAAWMICCTAEETSGPIPSPGMRVMVWVIGIILGEARQKA